MIHAEATGLCLTSNRVKSGDDFIGKLWDTHLRVKKEGYAQVRPLGCCDTLTLG